MLFSYLGLLPHHHWFFRWRGSIWQCIWRDLVIWCAFYAAISLTYRLAMTTAQKELVDFNCAIFLQNRCFNLTVKPISVQPISFSYF